MLRSQEQTRIVVSGPGIAAPRAVRALATAGAAGYLEPF
jgi:ribosomal protein S11